MSHRGSSVHRGLSEDQHAPSVLCTSLKCYCPQHRCLVAQSTVLSIKFQMGNSRQKCLTSVKGEERKCVSLRDKPQFLSLRETRSPLMFNGVTVTSSLVCSLKFPFENVSTGKRSQRASRPAHTSCRDSRIALFFHDGIFHPWEKICLRPSKSYLSSTDIGGDENKVRLSWISVVDQR